MMTRFGGVDDLLKSLKETKFPYVGIPYSFSKTFPNMVKIIQGGDNEFVEIKGEKFVVVMNVPELWMWIIYVQGN
jgi:hypothetical protein